MAIRIHAHALERGRERGILESEIVATIQKGEHFPAKFGRLGFRKNFPFDAIWRNRHYPIKQVEAIAVEEGADLVVITVITRYF
ncbi:MAG: DUF4258 domain-containing protein [Myxococcales bacterium]|nr:MAG: DUF4258 domain-containing protein [Myxococcales bacterium]